MNPASASAPICFVFPQPSVVATYRCYHHYRSARALGFEARMFGNVVPAVLEAHDLYAFVSPITPNATMLAEWLRSHSKRVWFDVPEDLFSALYAVTPEPYQRQGLEYARTCARYADVLTTSNQFLAAQCRSLNERVFVVPNYIDERVWQVPLPSRRSSFGIPDEALTIGWAGTAAGFRALRELEAVIGAVMRDHPDVVFITVGDDPQLAGLPPKRCRHLSVRGMDERVDFLHHIDIAVVEGKRDFSAKCLSDLRLLEHGMAGSAIVASRVRPFEELASIVPGLPLASNEAEWSESLSRLVSSESARRDVANALHEHVVGSRLLDRNAESSRAAIEALFDLPRGKGAR